MTRSRQPAPVSGPWGLPVTAQACLFDMDGVLTDTAQLHAAAWKTMFDDYLAARAERSGTAFEAFDAIADYDTYVDGKSREDGTGSFLESRDLDLPTGSRDDRPGARTIIGLGAAKDAIFVRRIRRDGVRAYPGSVRFLRAVRSAGLRTAVVSSSAHCAEVLRAAHLEDLFGTRIDGRTIESQQLAGKPAPDTYLAAAKALGVAPAAAAVFEDALAGVTAGRAGGFGWVVGVDRVGQADQLLAHGADRVVRDLAELLDQAGS